MVFIFALAAGWFNRDALAIKMKSVFVKTPPKAAQSEPPSKRPGAAVFGDAPWAMSALPECFTQISKTIGPAAYVLAHVPADVQMQRPGTTYDSADCALQVRGDTVLVTRGSDRLRIPPPARLYAGHLKAALLRGEPGGLELRVYAAKP